MCAHLPLVTNIFHTNWIFDRYESYESSSDRFERIANKLEQTSRKKKQEKRSDRFKWNGTRYNMLIFGREKSISKMEYIKLYKIYLTILV